MSRRQDESDPGIGSDSFLDVIANIVGILIILIVVSGLRVSRAPVVVPPREPAPAAVPPSPAAPLDSTPTESSGPEDTIASSPAPETPPNDAEPLATFQPEPAASPAPNPPVPAPVPVRIDPSPELLRRISELERELAEAAAQSDSARIQITAAEQSSRERTQQLASAAATVAAERSQLAAEEVRLSALRQERDSTHEALQQRQRVLDSAESQRPDVQPIRHRLTPVSHRVEGHEIHFHVHGGRLAYVPVDELITLLKADISRQKDWLARVPRHEGRVGPLLGFSMAYVVERQSMSILDELRVGGVVRIAVSEWRIIPEADFPSESAAEALAPGSVFIRRLQTTDLDTALTFWVYPDSFAEFRQLQELARSEGFTVAARPLPEGTPIAASPQGTRSAGQ
jgi:hypothetical protein